MSCKHHLNLISCLLGRSFCSGWDALPSVCDYIKFLLQPVICVDMSQLSILPQRTIPPEHTKSNLEWILLDQDGITQGIPPPLPVSLTQNLYCRLFVNKIQGTAVAAMNNAVHKKVHCSPN